MKPIGYIRSEYKEKKDIPNQSVYSHKKSAKIELLDAFKEGIEDIEAGSHGILLFHFHKSTGYEMKQRKMGRGELTGLFSLRSPNRPNPIGMTIVKFISIRDNIIEFEGVDMLDGTPLLDIKPYIESLNPTID
jgi:tRNA-Thr(GGU) m(6)t(6)A37 methyltransferase TsaA